MARQQYIHTRFRDHTIHIFAFIFTLTAIQNLETLYVSISNNFL